LPQAPFFLFDLDKKMSGEGGEKGARDFLKDTFFTSFEQQRKAKIREVGGSAIQRRDEQARLSDLLDKPSD
jgi:hypothetical protein